MNKWIVRILIVVVLAGLSYAGYWWYNRDGADKNIVFRTAPVKTGDLLSVVKATGTVQPIELVDIGAQVGGRIGEFGRDEFDKDKVKEVDYRTAVRAGQVLAKIDETLYEADVNQAKAQLAQANGALKKAKADVGQLKARQTQAERDWERAKKLGPSDALSRAEYDTYQSAYEIAKANVAVGEAAIMQAEGSVAMAEATMQKAKRNVEYCTITSPYDGVIIDRKVSIGQTVNASFNAPSLFTLARDLRNMEVLVAVNEADIAKIYVGQPVTFTVDARPGIPFPGVVQRIRLNAQISQNVVTYTVEVSADNSDLRLLPSFTATAQFEVARRSEVLLVPNAALRWTPKTEQIVAESRAAWEQHQQFRGDGRRRGGGAGSGSAGPATGPADGSATRPGRGGKRGDGLAGGSRSTENAATRPTTSVTTRPATNATTRPAFDAASSTGKPPEEPMTRGVLWQLQGNMVKPIFVRVGVTDGVNTEVQGEGLTENMQVVTGEIRPASAAAATPGASSNPLGPQPRIGGGRGGR